MNLSPIKFFDIPEAQFELFYKTNMKTIQRKDLILLHFQKYEFEPDDGYGVVLKIFIVKVKHRKNVLITCARDIWFNFVV